MNKKVYFLSLMFSLFSHFIFAQAGVIDSTYGVDGTAFIDIEGLLCYDLIELADKNALVLGVRYDKDTVNSYLARVKPNGTLDMTFGNNGVMLAVDSIGDEYYNIEPYDANKFLVYGQNYIGSKGKIILSRYTNDGQLDTNFGSNGSISFYSGTDLDYSFGVKVLQDQTILVSYALLDTDFVLKKYQADGSIDSSFGNSGTTQISLSDELSSFYSPSIDIANDKIVLMGGVNGEDEDSGVAVLRLNMDGSIDTDFGVNGWIHVQVPRLESDGIDFCRFHDNKMHISGITVDSTNDELDYLTTVQLNADGTLDLDYGEDGISIVPFPINDFGNLYGEVYASLVQPDGKIVIVGVLDVDMQMLCRLNADGTLDHSFGTNGFSYIESPDEDEGIGANVKLMSDLSLWCLGYYYFDNSNRTFGTITKYHSGLVTSTQSLDNRLIPMSVYPNPAHENIQVQFNLESGGEVVLSLMSLSGKKVAHLDKSWFAQGYHKASYNLPTDLASGNYLLTLRRDDRVSSFVVTVE